MEMRAAKMVLALSMFVVFAPGYVSAQQASPGQQDLQSLAGKWVGWGTPTSGSNFPVEVEVQPDGSYTSMMGSTMGRGTITKEGGKLVAEGHLSGAGSAAAGARKSEIMVTSKDGKQMISGTGRDERGPFNYRLTKSGDTKP